MTIIEELYRFLNDIKGTTLVYNTESQTITEPEKSFFLCSTGEASFVADEILLTENNCEKVYALENIFIIKHKEYLIIFVVNIPSMIEHLLLKKEITDALDTEYKIPSIAERYNIPDTPEELEALYPPVEIDE